MKDFIKKLFSNSDEVSSSRFIMVCSFLVSVAIAFCAMAVYYFFGKDYPSTLTIISAFLAAGVTGKIGSDFAKK